MNISEIEAVSNLIQAARLLGGAYHENTDNRKIIRLPCGRAVSFDPHPTLRQHWTVSPSWSKTHRGIIRRDHPPERIARFIRATVVKNDEELEQF